MIKGLQELNVGVDKFKVIKPVYYREQGTEVATSIRAYALGLPIIYKGPTGSGKSTLVEYLSFLLGTGFDKLKEDYKELVNKKVGGRETVLSKLEKKLEAFRDGGFPLILIAGNEDLDADSLKGRPYVIGDDVCWLNGGAKLAAQYGGMLYIDEPAEARPDVLVVIHSLSDHKKCLPVEGLGEIIEAHPSFGFAMSFNDKYQDPRKRFKPSTAQRFVHIPVGYPTEDVEVEILTAKVLGLDEPMARKLVKIAQGTRNMASQKKVKEGASPRELIYAANLIVSGESPKNAALYCLAHSLTNDPAVISGIEELIANQFRG